MKLVYFTYIDPLYISQAELEIKNLLNDYKLYPEWENHEELIIIPNNLLKIIKTIQIKLKNNLLFFNLMKI